MWYLYHLYYFSQRKEKKINYLRNVGRELMFALLVPIRYLKYFYLMVEVQPVSTSPKTILQIERRKLYNLLSILDIMGPPDE